MAQVQTADAVVIGGGFFGCDLAVQLRALGVGRVIVLEAEPALMRRASWVNQARVHGGYHYPRSLPTARRARYGLQQFVREFPNCVRTDVSMLYAVAHGSQLSVEQFMAVCARLALPCAAAPAVQQALFNPATIAAVFAVEEYAFDASQLAAVMQERLCASEVVLQLGCTARGLTQAGGAVRVHTEGGEILTPHLFNCTYAGLDQFDPAEALGLRKELAEIALIQPPPALRDWALTVVDGPFFSTMPFPAMGCHSLSHVRYTPHRAGIDVDARRWRPGRSRAPAMQRDAARYCPPLAAARLGPSLYEIKAVLMRREADDGRPIYIRRSQQWPQCWSVLGAKIDAIYDLRAWLASGEWSKP